jgi:hypothetical protein
MLLGRHVTNVDPQVRTSISLPQSVMNVVKDYQSFYKSQTGQELPMSTLVENVLVTHFFPKDKEFQAYRQAQSAKTAGAKKGAGTSAAA